MGHSNVEKTKLLDLPSEMLEKILIYLDFTTLQLLRMNRRLAKVERGIIVNKNRVHVDILKAMLPAGRIWHRVEITETNSIFLISIDNNVWKKNFNITPDRFEAMATYWTIGTLKIAIDLRNPEQFEFVKKLHMATSNNLMLVHHPKVLGGRPLNRNGRLDFAIIRDLLGSHSRVSFDSVCTSIKVDDLIRLREIIRTSEVNRFLEFYISNEVGKEYAERFFGVHRSSFGKGPMVRTNAQIEIYGHHGYYYGNYIKNDGDLVTILSNRQYEFLISFDRDVATAMDGRQII